MKKNVLYFVALIILALLTYYFVFREESDVFEKSETNFTVKDTASVKTIFLSNLKNENIKLSRATGSWILNDSLSPRIDAVNSLLAVLNQQKAEQPVSVAFHNSVITDLSANHTKIEIYTEKGRTHTFYVGRNPGPNNETYMLNDKAKRPYLVKLPLQNTFVGVRYFTQLSEWRNKKILYADAAIENISVVYKDSVRHSFTIENLPNKLSVTGNYTIEKPLNQKRVADYIKLFDNLFCMGFEDYYIYKDSIIQKGRQLATVTIKRKQSNPQQITFYFKPSTQGTKQAVMIGNTSYDYDLFFGLLNQKDFILLGRKPVERILKSYADFYVFE